MLKIPSQNGRALYALLDAAEHDGLITDDQHLKRWRELQERVKTSSYSDERIQLWELVKALDRSGHLEGTWIKAHWKRVETESSGANQGKALNEKVPPSPPAKAIPGKEDA